ncbi:MAG: M28 family peptidase [Myxococcales bacterium]|nr:M28 family peptidase [Myxococcales bacterium]
MKQRSLLLLIFGAALPGAISCAGSGAPGWVRGVARVDSAAYRSLVETLADDALEGRGVTTAGNARATALLVEEFRAAGLQPGGDAEGYTQCFEQPVTVRAAQVALSRDGTPLDESAVAPTAFSASAAFEGELLFAGYGIHAPELGYDDYAGLDVADKVLLVMRYEPREQDPDSPFNGDRPSRYSDLRRKVFEATNRGARALLLVAPPRAGEELDRKVPNLDGVEVESAAGLPVLHVLPGEVESWLREAGSGLREQVEAIDAQFASAPLALGRVRGEVRLERDFAQLCNVVGILPGRGRLADEAVVIGAHFDHLGYGQSGSMEPGVRAIHNGADDNASGAAGVVAAARLLQRTPLGEVHRQLIFVAFNAEEVNLAGSSAYVENPPVALARTRAMLNMDMIGRLREDALTVLGTESGDRWEAWLAAAAPAFGLALTSHGDGYGPSDQTPFYSGGVPVLHFFTGAHSEYHRPSDDAALLNYAGAARVVELVAALALHAAAVEPALAYRETSSGPPLAGDSRSYGAWLGTIPDYTALGAEATGGVLLGGVRKGSPAEAAGLRAADKIVEMDGKAIHNLYDMTFVLRDHHPGDVISIAVEREGARLVLAATLGSRSEMGGPHERSHESEGGAAAGQAGETAPGGSPLDPTTLLYPGEERHLRNLRQLTFAGENAEAYFAPDGQSLVFQARRGDGDCDRIFVLDIASGATRPISSGAGRTTCAYFTYPDGDAILYASTHLAGAACPPEPDRSRGYVWPLYAAYDLFLQRQGQPLEQLTRTPGYDAEATACFRDGRVVFTSLRDGDLELYTMDPRRPEAPPTRITHTPGYDGGAFFSPDCSRLVWRASRPSGAALDAYRALLAEGLVRPSRMQIVVADADGSNARQITDNEAANFAPYFLPDNRRVLFSSNLENPRGRNFDLYRIDPDAPQPEATLERITFSPEFDAFPMFSPDGRFLVFASNRNAAKSGDTNLFIAEWLD